MTRPGSKGRRLRPTLRHVAILSAVAALTACGGSDDDDPAPVEIKTLSNRADLVSGGDVLVEIVPPAGTDATGLSVRVGSRDVTSAFARRANGRITGVVTGLAEGQNVLVATVNNAREAQLTITNAPRSGPILSGAHVTPYYCATPTPQVSSGNAPGTPASGLAGAPDANCNIASETKLYYRTTAAPVSTANPGGCSLGLPDPVWSIGATATTVPAQPTPPANGCFKPYTAGSTPADMATTTTDSGATVPFIVRVERGTLNRGIYDIAVLINPAQPWTAVEPQATWNGKVYYSFGASTGQPRRQIRSTATAWTQTEDQLKRGYLVAVNSMTDSARNSNRVLMSETVMMMKEHITDTYGPIKFTIGTGCSGGSIASNMNASINPGLLDGIVTSCTYPDSETTTLEVGDCVLLVEAYQKPGMTALWTGLTQDQINAKKGAMNGHPDQSACHAWYNAFGSNGRAGLFQQRTVTNNVTGAITQAATATNNCELPNSAVYDPANPTTTANLPRCNAWSWADSIWGRVPGSPASRDTRDNVGVQYGLKAFRDGAITAEEFVTLNELVGGIDRDSTAKASRTVADAEALDIAYRSGIVASGHQLAKTAIIDLRGWDDSNIAANVPPGQTPGAIPIHHQWFSFAVRDRLTAAVGNAQNQALWRFARTGLTPPGTFGLDAFLSMDQWLTTLKADASSAAIEQKVRAARPLTGARDTTDFCLLPEEVAQTTRVFDQAVCDANRFLKPSLSPRQVAGGPRAEDVLKCQLKPLVASDYPAAAFTPAQFGRLQAVFPTGVCDWSKPGVGQQVAVSPLTFKAGPGGQPLGTAPTSTPR